MRATTDLGRPIDELDDVTRDEVYSQVCEEVRRICEMPAPPSDLMLRWEHVRSLLGASKGEAPLESVTLDEASSLPHRSQATSHAKRGNYDEQLIGRMDDIVGMNHDPVLRNLLITQCYFELSEAMGDVIGFEDANWCTFATWSSKTAGRFVRKEDSPELLRRILGVEEVQMMDGDSRPPPSSFDVFGPPSVDLGLLELPERILEEVSKLVARGNLLVFQEIGSLFARMVHIYRGNPRPDEEMLETLVAPLKRRNDDEEGLEDQELLVSAVTHYHNAVLSDDPDSKSELVLRGNALFGLHEQIRLQPYIKGSLNTPVGRLMRTIGGPAGRLPGVLQSAVESLIRPIAQRVGERWRELATKEMMRLRLPTGFLELGRDLPIQPGQPLYPEYLRTIEDQELHELLRLYGAHDSTAMGSGATDWSYLPARMSYILEFFRSRQCDPSLRARPFAPEQEAEILSERVPTEGSL